MRTETNDHNNTIFILTLVRLQRNFHIHPELIPLEFLKEQLQIH